MAAVSAPTPKLDRYIVVHVATTCDEHGVYVTKDSAEVIELGWILLDTKTCEEVSKLLIWVFESGKVETWLHPPPPFYALLPSPRMDSLPRLRVSEGVKEVKAYLEKRKKKGKKNTKTCYIPAYR